MIEIILANYLLAIGLFVFTLTVHQWARIAKYDRVFGVWVALNHLLPAIYIFTL
jgi:hypothetical protein